MQDWCKESKPIENLEVEICFLLQKDFFVGDPHDPEQLNDEKYRETLSLPEIEREAEMLVRTKEVEANEPALVEYYKEIADRAKRLHRTLNDVRQYFWCGLWLFNEDEAVRVSFPLHGTLEQIKKLLADFRNTESGVVVHIRDHGWEMQVVADGGYIYIKECDPDEDEVWLNIRVERGSFLNGIQQLQARTQRIIKRLCDELGEELCSEYFETIEFNP